MTDAGRITGLSICHYPSFILGENQMFVGWVKLHRETLEKAIWKCSTSEQKVIFITIIMLANHKHNQWIWKGKKFECLPGQFITSVKSIANFAEVSHQNVRTALKKFEKLEFLTNETTNDGRLITICNWDRYQNNETETNKPPNKPLTSGQQTPNKPLTTIKELKEREEVFKNEIRAFNSPHEKEFIDYWTEPNKSKTKMKFEQQRTWDTKRRLERWSKNNFGGEKETESSFD